MHLDPRLVFSLKVNHLLKKVEKRRITQTGLYALWWNVQFNAKKILVVVLPLMTTQPLRLFKSEQPWCRSQARINGEGCDRKGIRHKT